MSQQLILLPNIHEVSGSNLFPETRAHPASYPVGTGVFPSVVKLPRVNLIFLTFLVSRLRMCGDVPPLPHTHVCMVLCIVKYQGQLYLHISILSSLLVSHCIIQQYIILAIESIIV
jgi:hypothetical protein